MKSEESDNARLESLQRKIDVSSEKLGAARAMLDQLKAADSIADTEFSQLFHEARTSSPGAWKKATAFIDIVDGKATVSEVAKISEGDWSPDTRAQHDITISVSVTPFMSSRVFRSELEDAMSQQIQGETWRRETLISHRTHMIDAVLEDATLVEVQRSEYGPKTAVVETVLGGVVQEVTVRHDWFVEVTR